MCFGGIGSIERPRNRMDGLTWITPQRSQLKTSGSSSACRGQRSGDGWRHAKFRTTESVPKCGSATTTLRSFSAPSNARRTAGLGDPMFRSRDSGLRGATWDGTGTSTTRFSSCCRKLPRWQLHWRERSGATYIRRQASSAIRSCRSRKRAVQQAIRVGLVLCASVHDVCLFDG